MNVELRDQKYFVDGANYARVSSILQDGGVRDFSNLPNRDREFFLYRGSWIHAGCKLLVRGELDWGKLEKLARGGGQPTWVGYVRAADKFLQDSGAEPLLSEATVVNVGLQYAGTLDLTMRFQDRLWLPDWKSHDAQRSTRIQTALYVLALPSARELHGYEFANEHHERMGIGLNEDGKYKLRFYDDDESEEDYQVAMAALTLARWRARG